ncbi:hypothetical protein HY571_00700, partial [Candidatus Micrarchaeota archaeon]|nr:hypothetical protein [Candidatus Micrarchaeota archaeon]
MPERDGEESSFIGKLKQFYYKLEDGYYALLDKLHESGVDLYKYFVEPIESRGIPSFPVAVALILVIIGAVFIAFTGFEQTGNLRVSVAGAPDGLPVTLLVEGN